MSLIKLSKRIRKSVHIGVMFFSAFPRNRFDQPAGHWKYRLL